MNFFKKRVKSRKTIYYVCGIPVYIKRLTTNDMAYNISKKIRKLEICAYPEITSLPPAVGQKREIQLANLKILLAVDEFCRKHNIRYWISDGTALGAARHGDFIPWDDDIDISMLRSDYDKMIEIFNKENKNPDLILEICSAPKGIFNFLKIEHKQIADIWVDIFPFDLYSEKIDSWDKRINLTAQADKLLAKNKKRYKKGTDKKVLHQYYQNLYKQFLNGKIPAPEKECPDIVVGFEFHTRPKYSMFLPYDFIFPLKEIKFCNHKFFCPNNMDAYLTNLFGVYMDYPSYLDQMHTNIDKMPIEEVLKIKEFIKK